MANLSDGTPRDSMLVASLSGERFHVVTPEQARGIPGARTWEVSKIPAQGTQETAEAEMTLNSFHDGAGFSYAGMPNVYERSNGWDASAPGKISTWARHATGESITTVAYRGWAVFHAGRLYVFRGRYGYWYGVGTTAGAQWTRTASLDLGSDDLVVGGRPAIFKGKLYVPVVNASTGADQRFQELTTVGAPDTWTQGPAGLETRCFRTWHNQKTGAPLLVAGTENIVQTVSENPMTLADWSADILVGDTSAFITDLYTWRDMVLVPKENGLFSVDQVEVATNELPDLQSSLDTFNGVGGDMSNGFLFIPHKAGLIRWQPNAYRFVGPQQEGALEADITPGWGRVMHVTPFGKYAFISVADTVNEVGTIYGLEPPRGQRGPLVPHAFHSVSSGYFEGMCVVQDANDIRSYLVALKVNAAATVVEPWVYQLPRADLPPGSDPTIVKARDSATFYTPRYWQPGREIQKSYRVVEFWLEAAPTTGTPGLEVWARVDEATAIQLTDEDGDPGVFLTGGFKSAYFPLTAVGSYVQLEFRIPAKEGAEVDMAATIRDVVLRFDLDPVMSEVVATSLVCGPGEYEDKTSSRLTAQKQLDFLRALDDPQAAAVAIKDPWGSTFYGKVMVKRWREHQFKTASASTFIVDVEIRGRKFSA